MMMRISTHRSSYLQKSLIKKTFLLTTYITTTLFLWPVTIHGQQNNKFHKRVVLNKTEKWEPGRIDDTRHVVDSFFYENEVLKEVIESIIKREQFRVVDSIPYNERKVWTNDGQILISEQFSEGRIIGIKSNYPPTVNIIQNGSFETNGEIPKHEITKIKDPLIICKPSGTITEQDTIHIQQNKDGDIMKFILLTKETVSNCENDYSRIVQKYVLIEENQVIIDSIYVRTPEYIHKGQRSLVYKHHDCNYETLKINVNSWKSLGQAYPNIYDLRNRAPMHPLTGLADSVFYFEPIAGNNFVKLMASQLTSVICNPMMAHPLLQNTLATTLIKNQKYYLEFWLWKPKWYSKNRPLKVYFSQEPITINNYQNYSKNAFLIPEFNDTTLHQWQKVSLNFEAPEYARYMTLGFFDFENDNFPGINHDSYHRWCYVDGFILVDEAHKDKVLPNFHSDKDYFSQIPKLIESPMVFNHKIIEKKQPVVLENIYFELDSYQLLPESLSSLVQLATFMQEHPDLIIEVVGYTDNIGTKEYNMYLSAKRAEAVVLKLIEHGIDADRLSWKGYGSNVPVSNNDTEEGRKKNRRVEFVVF